MKKIKNLAQLKAQQQKLVHQQIRLEEKISYQWQTIKQENKTWLNAASWGYSLLSGSLWKKTAKYWTGFFK